MKNLSFFLLGLALNYIPTTYAKQCFSESLKPAYPCCKGDKVVLTDKDGQWGVENGNWCGIGGGDSSKSCFSIDLGYPCCKGDTVVYTDDRGDWGVEDNKWCGIGESPDACFSIALGYPCCEACNVVYSDDRGDWGVENKSWCGIKNSCSTNDDPIEEPTEEPTEEPIEEPTEEPTEEPEPYQEGNDFEFEFLKMENNKKNMLYSPLSIEYALNMLQEGASNNTLAEIKKVIGDRILTKYASIGENMSFANGLFVRDTFYDLVLPSYMDTLKEKYDAEVIEDPFESAKNTNEWIEDKTLGIIKNMLKDEIFENPFTAMLIINALAIDMEWANGFDTERTYGTEFYKDDGEVMITTMMSKRKIFNRNIGFYLDEQLTVLTMNLKKYDDVQLEFMALMPKNDLSGFVKNVTKAQIEAIDEQLLLSTDTEYGVNIEIPKFKFNYDLKLKEDLIQLGIEDAFDAEKADFSKMAVAHNPEDKLYVSDAFHKADIEFSEDGIKAAAVTVFVMSRVGSARPVQTYPVNIVIDKPFMFIIRDKATKDIWFTGTVYEPNLWDNNEKKSYELDFGF